MLRQILEYAIDLAACLFVAGGHVQPDSQRPVHTRYYDLGGLRLPDGTCAKREFFLRQNLIDKHPPSKDDSRRKGDRLASSSKADTHHRLRLR